jgi:hypothetical protein
MITSYGSALSPASARRAVTSPTISASSAGLLASRPSPPSMTVGIRPSQRAARASDGCRDRPAIFAPMTQTGGRGRWTGGSGTSSSTGLAA